MNCEKLTLNQILVELKKENSGVIFGNGLCSWLYQGVDAKLYDKYRWENWKLNEIISRANKKFSKKNDINIAQIILDDSDIDRIYNKIQEEYNKNLADKWLTFFLKEILEAVNYDRIKKTSNLYKFKIFTDKIEFYFTTNYDPSFYWLILRVKKISPNRSKEQIKKSSRGGVNTNFDDGFDLDLGNLKFKKRDSAKVFYLHGAIFLIKDINEKYPIKLSRKNTKKDFVSTCKNYLESLNSSLNYSPLLTVIGKNKNEDIQKNDYLSFALNKLSNCNQIITFGLSFSEDMHLIENIIKQCNASLEPKYLYIGCYNLESDKSEANPSVNLKKYFEMHKRPNNLNIYFYEAKEIDNLVS